MTIEAGFAAGSAVVVRDEEWIVSSCERIGDGWCVRCTGSTELVRGTTGTFYTDLDHIEPLDPAGATLVQDDSPRYRRSRLWVEAMLRKTPVPLHEPGLTVSQDMLLDALDYQRQAVAMALDGKRLRPRLLIADAVGLGKTLEIGMILAELTRRGRAERVLVVTPRHVLEQMQYELWTRFSLPLVRLDSAGIQKVRQTLPASRNPFTYYSKVIVSIDTLKSDRYRAHLEKHQWDAVVIDESHNVTNAAAQRSELARTLARQTDTLILASATPHNGNPESFAELINLLDPTAVVDRKNYEMADIKHLFVRRHRHSPAVAKEVGHSWAERPEPEVLAVKASPEENAVADELSAVWLHPTQGSPIEGKGSRLFPWTLAKAFLSSPAALAQTIENRQKRLAAQNPPPQREIDALDRLADLAAAARTGSSAKLDGLVQHLESIGIAKDGDTRVVLFSERVATLHWLSEQLPKRLGLPAKAFEVLHGGLPDDQQMRIVEDFRLAGSAVRVLITGDVASEGVNLHKRCHHLVHVDIPWSLIRIEQRNGRIDRYGQSYPPRIVALALTTSDGRFSGDVRVISKLLTKEHAAHVALGDAASLLRLHDIGREEEQIRRALEKGADIDEVVPEPRGKPHLLAGEEYADDSEFESDEEYAPDSDFEDDYAAAGEDVDPPPRLVGKLGLFDREVDFLREALNEAFSEPTARPEANGVGWKEHPDEGLVELVPPKDLFARLKVLPESYLSQRQVAKGLLLAVTPEVGEQQLRQAVDETVAGAKQTQWPRGHFLSPLHPVVDWAVDRALTRLGRNQVPVATAAVDVPTALVIGTLTNKRGQVVLRSVVGMQFPPGSLDPIVVDDADGVLRAAGFRSDAVNPNNPIDLEPHRVLVPAAVDRMRSHMGWLKEQRAEIVRGPLKEAARAVADWRRRATAHADTLPPPQAEAARHRVEQHRDQAYRLMDSLGARPEPMVRVLLLLIPNGASA